MLFSIKKGVGSSDQDPDQIVSSVSGLCCCVRCCCFGFGKQSMEWMDSNIFEEI
jgi:hypothetical protein